MTLQTELKTARSVGLVSCNDCYVLSSVSHERHSKSLCASCGSTLHSRKPYSVQTTWALLFAAALLIVPANTLTMLTAKKLSDGGPDTIYSGVITLINEGLWGIAVIVFVASIIVPVFKIVGIAALLLIVQCRIPLSRLQCQRLYRLIHFIGRWSMLDLFVIAVLVTLGSLGALASVEAGPAATAFGAVVVLTMLASQSFDTRLLWDLEHE